jgi:hypothetical protein
MELHSSVTAVLHSFNKPCRERHGTSLVCHRSVALIQNHLNVLAANIDQHCNEQQNALQIAL